MFSYIEFINEMIDRKYYTIGWYYKKQIDLAKKGKLMKLGRNDNLKLDKDENYDPNYEGGIVFMDINEIEEYAKETNVKNFKDFSIFELLNCNKNDVYRIGKNSYLLNSKYMKYLGKYDEIIKNI